MQQIRPKNQSLRLASAKGIAVLSLAALATSNPAGAEDRDHTHIHFFPGNLVVSRSVYDNNANNVKVGALLPPNCANTVGPCIAATNNGAYPFVFNNDTIDSSFGWAPATGGIRNITGSVDHDGKATIYGITPPSAATETRAQTPTAS